MKDNRELKADFKDTVKKFEKYSNDHEQFHKVFTELGFTYIDDGCSGFCPECKQKSECEVYKEIKDEWKEFYS